MNFRTNQVLFIIRTELARSILCFDEQINRIKICKIVARSTDRYEIEANVKEFNQQINANDLIIILCNKFLYKKIIMHC